MERGNNDVFDNLEEYCNEKRDDEAEFQKFLEEEAERKRQRRSEGAKKRLEATKKRKNPPNKCKNQQKKIKILSDIQIKPPVVEPSKESFITNNNRHLPGPVQFPVPKSPIDVNAKYQSSSDSRRYDVPSTSAQSPSVVSKNVLSQTEYEEEEYEEVYVLPPGIESYNESQFILDNVIYDDGDLNDGSASPNTYRPSSPVSVIQNPRPTTSKYDTERNDNRFCHPKSSSSKPTLYDETADAGDLGSSSPPKSSKNRASTKGRRTDGFPKQKTNKSNPTFHRTDTTKEFDWDDFNNQLTFIEFMANHPHIYNRQDDLHKDHNEVDKSFEIFANENNTTIGEAKKKWLAIKKKYTNMINKVTPSGSETQPVSEQDKRFLAAMSFMNKYSFHRKSKVAGQENNVNREINEELIPEQSMKLDQMILDALNSLEKSFDSKVEETVTNESPIQMWSNWLGSEIDQFESPGKKNYIRKGLTSHFFSKLTKVLA